MLEIAVYACTHHLALHPGFARFLLSECVRAVNHAHGLDRTIGIGATEVVALAATTVVENAGTIVLSLDRRELCGDLSYRGAPVDVLIASVYSPAFWAGDAVGPVLIKVHAL